MFGIFNTLRDAWHKRNKEKAQSIAQQQMDANDRFRATSKAAKEANKKKFADILTDAFAANKRFLTLESANMSHSSFVVFLTQVANEESRVLDVKFHSSWGNAHNSGGMATLTLRQTDI